MTTVVAYVPVLHEGYRRFFERHAGDDHIHIVGDELVADDRAIGKDIRRLSASFVAAAVDAWGIGSGASVLTRASAAAVAERGESLVLPAEDVSYRLVDELFPRAPVAYDTVFLRWDKTRTAQLLEPSPNRTVDPAHVVADLRIAADEAAGRSIDWWRRVGAALRTPDGDVRVAANRHLPHELSAYAVGDPRSNFFKGVHLELSTAFHAEAQLVAAAARDGLRLAGSVVYVTDFPCPPCAKLLAGAGVATVYYSEGYAVLDGQDVLESAGVEIVRVAHDDDLGVRGAR